MVLGVVVTYNPNISELEKNILAIKNQIDKVVIFDNKSVNQDEIVILCKKIAVEIIVNNENIGLGAAYNFVFKRDFSDFDYFTTFDQDTFIKENTINNLISLFAVAEKVGIVGPSFVKKHLQIYSDYSFVDSLIQSCSVFSKDVLSNAGYFNEKLFIDSVDFEYCLRAQLLGFKIIRSNRLYIVHDLGSPKNKYGMSYIEHSALRNYYIARNHRYLSSKFITKFPHFIIKKNFFFGVHCLKLIFLDQDLTKVKHIIKGLGDKVT
jgi:rhamnosyltransferase